jgi:hypothetical protein
MSLDSSRGSINDPTIRRQFEQNEKYTDKLK